MCSQVFGGLKCGTKPGNWLGLYKYKQLLKKLGRDIFVETRDHVFSMALVVRS